MAGLRGRGGVFQRRRKRSGSSRTWAMKSRRPAPLVPMQESSERAAGRPTPELTPGLTPGSQVRAVFAAAARFVQICRETIHHVCEGLLGAALFWRGQGSRLEELSRRVDELERELTLLKSAGATCAAGPSETPGAQSGPLPHTLPPPPPPPPPPPLPLLLTAAAPKVSLIPKKSAQASSLKEPGPVAVTLRDLQAVRLRKVTSGQRPQASPDRKRSPLVTLADLQKVRLRRSHTDLSLKLRSGPGRTPTKNATSLRVQLRKVNLIRSPGGTPLCNKENDGMDPNVTSGSKRLRALSPLKPF